MVPIGIDCADQPRHGHVAVASDLLHAAIRLFVLGFYRDQIDLAKDRTRETLVKPIAVVR